VSDWRKRAGSGALSVWLRKNAEFGRYGASTGNLPERTLVDIPPVTHALCSESRRVFISFTSACKSFIEFATRRPVSLTTCVDCDSTTCNWYFPIVSIA
jgi:hypothetical protein